MEYLIERGVPTRIYPNKLPLDLLIAQLRSNELSDFADEEKYHLVRRQF